MVTIGTNCKFLDLQNNFIFNVYELRFPYIQFPIMFQKHLLLGPETTLKIWDSPHPTSPHFKLEINKVLEF